MLLGWAGVGHWLLFATGMSGTYSCYAHGLVQMQAFMSALAVGFLLTASPRRTQSAAPTRAELVLAAALLVRSIAPRTPFRSASGTSPSLRPLKVAVQI